MLLKNYIEIPPQLSQSGFNQEIKKPSNAGKGVEQKQFVSIAGQNVIIPETMEEKTV